MRKSLRAIFPVEFLLILASVLFCEMALRYVAEYKPGALPKQVREIPLNGYYPPPHVFNNVTGYLYRPNFKGRMVRADFDNVLVTNNYGFHDTDWTLAKPNNVIRVAVIGDSYLAANQVTISQQWLSLIEKNFPACGNKRVELMNFGIDGFFSWNWIRLLDYRVMQFSPDVVILWSQWTMMQKIPYPTYRDATPDGTIISTYSVESLATLREENRHNRLTFSVLLNRYSYLARYLQYKFKKMPVTKPNVISTNPDSMQPLPHYTPQETVLLLNKLCRARGVGFGVYWRLGDGPPEQEAKALAGVHSASDAGIFNSLRPLAFEHDAHFSQQGNALYAKKTMPVFEKLITSALADKRF